MWLISSLWFRAEVRGMGNVPAEGPVLLIGNHSGGHLTPDTLVFSARLLDLLPASSGACTC